MRRVSSYDPRETLAAIAKITCFVVAPFLAVGATLRVGMTALGLDRVSWGQWSENFFGPVGVNFAVTLFFLALLGPSGATVAIWRGVRFASRLLLASLRRPDRNLATILLYVVVAMVLPVGGVWLFPEAWNSWWTWVGVGLVVCLPGLWSQVFTSGPGKVGAVAAGGVVMVMTASLFWSFHLDVAESGLLWFYPMCFVTILLPVASMAAGAARHLGGTRHSPAEQEA